MYIPVSFFGAGQGCITATGGVTGSYISGGVLWKYHQFDANTFTTSSFNVLSGSNLNGKLLIVGGGGSGGAGVGSGGATGGGGAGGVVYYDQFPIITGSYQVVVGRGGEGVYGYALVGTYIANVGLNGTTSSVQFPYGAYPPFTSSLLTAYGGGGGGVAGLGVTASNGVVAGQGGASGGGNAQGQASTGYLPSLESSSCIGGYGDIYNGPQGNFGGSIPQDVYLGFNTGYMITGGGGAGAPSLSVLYNSGSNGSPAKSDGGIGRLFDITGTPSYYAGGAGGSSSAYGASNNGLGANNWGGGGKGRLTYSPDPSIFSDPGVGGAVIFAYPLCPFTNDCITYTGYAGSTNATLTFVDCYTNTTMSKTIPANTSSSICSRPFVQYPYITGTGASLTSGSSCTSQTVIYKSYILTQCGTTSSINVSISDSASLSIGNVIKLIPTYTSSCYYVTSNIGYDSSYPIQYVSKSYINCDECNNDPFTGSYTIDYLIVGGGGGGGAVGPNGEAAGGGGGGQYLTGSLSISASNIFNITIGAGGAISTNGNSSSLISTTGPSVSLTSFGGGYGGYGTSSILNNGTSGANGGGGGVDFDIAGIGGTGFSGSNGAAASYSSPFPPQKQSGGGGGGNNGTPPTGSNGLTGAPGGSGSLWFNGNYYSAGGAGGFYHTGTGGQSVTAGLGGSSIGGNGAYRTSNIGNPGASATSPTEYRGAGGGGAVQGYSASGGSSGSVVLRYSSSFQIGSGGTITQSGGYFYHTFTSNGTYDASYNS